MSFLFQRGSQLSHLLSLMQRKHVKISSSPSAGAVMGDFWGLSQLWSDPAQAALVFSASVVLHTAVVSQVMPTGCGWCCSEHWGHTGPCRLL